MFGRNDAGYMFCGFCCGAWHHIGKKKINYHELDEKRTSESKKNVLYSYSTRSMKLHDRVLIEYKGVPGGES